MKNAVIIFARNPLLGKVKTRIAATAGKEKALGVYIELLTMTKSILDDVNVDKFVFYSDEINMNDLWKGPDYRKYLQQGSTLGERMNNAFVLVFAMGYDSVAIIGTDCPSLTSDILNSCFKLLDHLDAVIGPATDGGYYLLGMRTLHSILFENKSWSTVRVFDDTVNDFKSEHLSFQTLPILTDIDTEIDWLDFKAKKSTQE